jgi:BirA family biotin operon repressor/biotin-[acetyl-CoA-carboxylase] ligase
LSLPNQKGFPFILLHTVDSTNNYAMGMVHEGMAQHGAAVFSREQTKGRGQRNRHWISETGMNIALSVILEINDQFSASRMFLLSKAMALAAARFFNRYTTETAFIKWPNDIYLRDRKAGGILIENILKGNAWKFSIAGVGLNINQDAFGELATKAISLYNISGKKEDPEVLARQLHEDLMFYFQLLVQQPEEVTSAYDALLYKKGEMIRFKKQSQVFEARVVSVTDFGELVVQHAVEEKFSVGEVAWVL